MILLVLDFTKRLRKQAYPPIKFMILLGGLFMACQPKEDIGLPWTVEELAEGVVWKYILNMEVAGVNQTINVLEVDLTRRYTLKVAYDSLLLRKSSVRALEEGAVAALNGNFFSPGNGGSVCYFKMDHQLVNTSKPDPNDIYFLPMLDEGAVVQNETGEWEIATEPAEGWVSLQDMPTVLSSGPMLVANREILEQEDIPFMNDRHARTAVGLTEERLILVVVDGYREQSAGMSTVELANLMKALGCVNALNLDGGGSSTMWVAQKGILNYPNDNENQFDHEGERAVANTLLIIPE